MPVYFATQDVPDWFRGPRVVIHWKEQNLRMMLWWGSQRSCNSLLDRDEAQNLCRYAAIETVQNITTFCVDHAASLNMGLSWYATYFLFQATIVLSIHYLSPSQSVGSNQQTTDQELWLFSISRARDCLAQLGQTCQAATRCLAVLDRIKDQSQAQNQFAPTSEVQVPNTTAFGSSPAYTATVGNYDLSSSSFTIDPALQIFLQDSSWNADIFDGLHGFPSTDEAGAFDYISGNREWPLMTD